MNWTAVVIGIIISIYLGTVVGLYSLCVENPKLHKAKKYTFYVPGFMILCIIYGIFSSNRDYRQTMIKFLRIPHKSIIMLYSFAEVIAEKKEKQPRKVPQRKAVFDGVANLLQNIFQGNQSAYYCIF